MRIADRRLLLVMGLMLAAELLFAVAVPAQVADAQFQRSFNLQSGGTLAVDNHKGLIRVTASDGNQVVVNVLKKFEGSEKDKNWWMANTEVNFSSSPSRLEISVAYPSCNCPVSDLDTHQDYEAAVELTIQVPRKINLDLKGHKPIMEVSGTDGTIRITSHKSPILVQSTSGAIRIETFKDSVNLKDVAISGGLDLQIAKGEASLGIKSVAGPVNLETEKGTIVLRLPQNTAMTVDYEGGRRSSFHSDFPIASEASSGNYVRGTINGGGTQVHLRSTKGSITLQKF